MRITIPTLCLFILLLSHSCGSRRDTDSQLDFAESIMDDHPESALKQLEGMMPFVHKFDASYQHRFWLDYVDAKNKSYQKLGEKEQIKNAASFYTGQKDFLHAAKAFYLLGSIYRDCNDTPAAIRHWFNATNWLKQAGTLTQESNRFMAIIYGQIAFACGESYIFSETLSACDSAEKYAWRSQDVSILQDCYNLKTAMLFNLHQYDSVIARTNQLRDLLLAHHDTTHAAGCLINSIPVYLERKEWNEAEKRLEIYRKESGLVDSNDVVKEDNQLYYYYKGLYLLGIGLADSARTMFSKELNESQDWNNIQNAYGGIAKYFWNKKMADSAFIYSQKQVEAIDSAYFKKQIAQIQQLKQSYDYSMHEQMAREKESEIDRMRLTTTVCLCLAIIALGSAFALYHHVKSRRRYRAVIEQVRNSKIEIEIRNLNTQLTRMIQNQEFSMDEIEKKRQEIEQMIQNHAKLLENAKQNKGMEKEELKASKIVIRFMQLSTDGKVAKEQDWNDLHNDFLTIYPTFIRHLQEAYKDISKMEMRVCMLRKLDFSPSEIGVLVSRERSSISNTCTRLYNKVFGLEQSRTKDFDDWLDRL